MPHQFDATLKEILAPRPEEFAPVFDLPRIAPAQSLNVDLSTISAATDVAFSFGAPLQEVVDLPRRCAMSSGRSIADWSRKATSPRRSA